MGGPVECLPCLHGFVCCAIHPSAPVKHQRAEHPVRWPSRVAALSRMTACKAVASAAATNDSAADVIYLSDPPNIDFKIKTTQWFNTYKTTTIHDGKVSFTKLTVPHILVKVI